MAANAAGAAAPSHRRGVVNVDRKHAAMAVLARERRADAAVVDRARNVQSKANGLSLSNGAISLYARPSLSGRIARNGSPVTVVSNPGSTRHLNRGAMRSPAQNGREKTDRGTICHGKIGRVKHDHAPIDHAKIGPVRTGTSNRARMHGRSL